MIVQGFLDCNSRLRLAIDRESSRAWTVVPGSIGIPEVEGEEVRTP